MSLLLNDPTIICPKCSNEIRLTESLSAPILAEARHDFDKQMRDLKRALADREKANQEQNDAINKREQQLQAEVEARVKAGREQIAQAEARKAQLVLSDQLKANKEEIAELERVVEERDKKLTEARANQVELKRQERKLAQRESELDLTVETRVNQSLAQVRTTAAKDAEARHKLKLAEKEETILAMNSQLEDLRRKAEQRSQQLQGEVQELELEKLLRAKFPGDIIEPVQKGVAGADVLQHILGLKGQTCGTIIWESKRTKSWSDHWLPKLRSDQRAANADAAILVSEALPKGLETFDLLNDVWVAEFKCVVPIATAVRHALIEIAASRKVEEGQQTKREMVYRYLTGQRFRQRVTAIVDNFTDMQEDLERERRVATKNWSKRECQIRGVIEATAGMYGDLQGIAGRSLQEVEGLDHKISTASRTLKS